MKILVETIEDQKLIDVRTIPHSQRHQLILKEFSLIVPGKTLLIVNDHEPVHLYQYMKHECRDFDVDAYQVYQKDPYTWIAVFKKSSMIDKQRNSKNIITSFDKEQCFDDKGFSPIPIYSTENYKVILTYFKAGQFIPVHAPKVDLVFLVYEGKGEVVIGDQHHKIISGDIIVVP